MNIFVSGATGYIGSRLSLKLAGEGHTVHALYRSLDKTRIINHRNIRLFKGDIMDEGSLDRALVECEAVYHTAAFTRVWMRDAGKIYRLNIEGTINVLRASLRAGIKKIVVTSTAGVLGSSTNGSINEDSVTGSFFIDYETSKFILEKILILFSGKAMDITIVNPTRVYGPGPLTESNGVTRMIDRYCRGKWHYVPGDGMSTGNYVFVDDVVEGHILAMEKGRSGERYILGGENVSYRLFFERLSDISGRKFRIYGVPLFILYPVAGLMLLLARITGKGPMITPSLVRKFSKNFLISSEKARKELGYKPSDLSEGLKKTVNWLNSIT